MYFFRGTLLFKHWWCNTHRAICKKQKQKQKKTVLALDLAHSQYVDEIFKRKCGKSSKENR